MSFLEPEVGGFYQAHVSHLRLSETRKTPPSAELHLSFHIQIKPPPLTLTTADLDPPELQSANLQTASVTHIWTRHTCLLSEKSELKKKKKKATDVCERAREMRGEEKIQAAWKKKPPKQAA